MIRPHHGHVPVLGAVLFGLILALAVGAVSVPLGLDGGGLREGDIAPRALTALRSAQYESAFETQQLRDAAAAGVPPIYVPPDPSIAAQRLAKLTALLDSLRTIRQRTDLSEPARLAEAQRLPDAAGLSAPTLLALIQSFDTATFDTVRELALRGTKEIMVGEVRPGQVEQRVDAYLDQPCADGTLCHRPPQVGALQPLRELLRVAVTENVRVDEQATQAAREAARAQVLPVIVTWSRGQVIAPEGKVLNAGDIESLKATGIISDGFDYIRAAGAIILAVGFGLIGAVVVYRAQPFDSPVGWRMALCLAAIVLLLVAARIAFPFLMPDRDRHYLFLLVPLPAAAMVAALAAETSFAALIAAAVGLVTAFMGAAVPDIAGAEYTGSLEALRLAMAVTAGGLGGAVVMGRGRHPLRFIAAGFVIAAGVGAVLTSFWLLSEPRAHRELAWAAGVSAGAGATSALTAAMFAAVGLRRIGHASRTQLLRLAQPSHPILRRLELEAPGTYHHSQMVATLAERAAERIGADALLARVGALYHDIGKLAQPRYYIENMLDGQPSPHDSLPPETSASIIRDHVTNGLVLAKEYRLPQVVVDFIPQHHGTRLVSFFYRRAAEQRGEVDQSLFRYPGPRPTSRESAIVMLADSCEALVRATADRNIDALVESVINERLAEGQLNDCDITLRELQAVGAAFKDVLRAVYHPRIAYPDPRPDELALLARYAEAPPAELPTPSGPSRDR